MQPPRPVEGMPPNMMGAPWGPPPKPRGGTVLAMFAVVAFLFLAGTGVFQAREMIEAPQNNTEYQEYLRMYQEYLRTIRLMTFVGAVLIDAAAFLGILFGAYVGVSRPDLPEGVRRAFVMGPFVLAGLWLLAYFATLRPSGWP